MKLEKGAKRKALVILCGPPASGKSTWGKQFALENDLAYISTDAIRAEIGTGEGDQTVSSAAFAGGKSAMIDATSVNRKSRRDWINLD